MGAWLWLSSAFLSSFPWLVLRASILLVLLPVVLSPFSVSQIILSLQSPAPIHLHFLEYGSVLMLGEVMVCTVREGLTPEGRYQAQSCLYLLRHPVRCLAKGRHSMRLLNE